MMNTRIRFGVSTWNYLKAFGEDVELGRAVEEIRDRGFGAELWLDWPRRETTLGRKRWADLKKLTAGIGGLTLHSRLIHEHDLDVIREELDLCDYLGGSLVVFHPKSFGFAAGSWDYRSPSPFDTEAEELLLRALSYAKEKKVGVAFENGPLDLLVETVERVGKAFSNEVFGICLDTSHANMHSREYAEPLGSYLDVLGERIIHIHASDNHGRTDDHLVPGTGSVSWGPLLDFLGSGKYGRSIVFELNSSDPEGTALEARAFFLERMP